MEIRKYIALFVQWWWMVFLGMLVFGGTVYFISINTTPVYRASTRLLIDPSSDGDLNYSNILAIEKILQTNVALLTTSAVLQETIQRLGLPHTTDQLRSLVSTSIPVDTQMIDVSVEDTNPERGRVIADTLAQVFIEQSEATQSARYAEPVNSLQEENASIADEIETLETAINELLLLESRTPEQEAQLSRLETQRNGLQLRYTSIFNRLEDLEIRLATERNNIVVIEPARAGSAPVRPRTIFNTLLASAVGGMLALGVIFLMDYLDDTIKSPEQIVEDTGLATIGLISHIQGNAPSDRLITHTTPRAPTSEAYRVLRTNLEFASIDQRLRRVLITSPSPSEGKSTTAANLATVMAQAGHRVIIVDADLRRPSQHKIIEVRNNQGLTTALLDSSTPINYHLQRTRIPGLQVMTSGPLPPNPTELLRSQRMQQILTSLEREADIVVIDTPPTLTVADASLLAPRTDGCVLVTRLGETQRHALLQASTGLQKTGANLFGVVLNNATPGRRNAYYHRYYSYEYREKRASRRQRGLLSRWMSGTNRP